MLGALLFLASFVAYSLAATLTYNWDITWVSAAPDGFTRPVIGINGIFPCPTIKANVGDQIVINVNNQLGNQTTSLHWHGINQYGSSEMDGPSGVTQCPIPPGSSFTYKYTVDTPGTYWYHSHNHGQYPDGLRGPLIVYDPNDPYAGQFGEDIVLTTSDWYHEQVPNLLPQMLSSANVHAAPPFPDSILFNDFSSTTLNFSPGETYKIRVISMAALASTMLSFDSHNMTVIEIDGVYVNPFTTTQIRVAPAQRYTFLMTALSSAESNYAFLGSLDVNRDYTQSAAWNINATGYIVYDSTKSLPDAYSPTAWTPLSDWDLSPSDSQGLLPNPDQTITLDFNFGVDSNGIPRAYLNGNSYVAPKVPTLYSVMTTGASATDPVVYGAVNAFVVAQGQTVQIVLNNLDAAIHPFHLHGHNFQVVHRPASNSGSWDGDSTDFPSIPMRRDVAEVFGQSHLIIRYTADNPGVQLFHCHIEWHVEMGLSATIIEAPTQIQSSVSIPKQHLQNCQTQGIPTAGNAAGNTSNFTDLTGANTSPPSQDLGATYVVSTSKPRKR